ncbi:hypothetical protein FRC05_007322 [Tulasnella sp. 425]|nr:hypothetical protein FRC05_007322 [Tulasnella sp. 425]
MADLHMALPTAPSIKWVQIPHSFWGAGSPASLADRKKLYRLSQGLKQLRNCHTETQFAALVANIQVVFCPDSLETDGYPIVFNEADIDVHNFLKTLKRAGKWFNYEDQHLRSTFSSPLTPGPTIEASDIDNQQTPRLSQEPVVPAGAGAGLNQNAPSEPQPQSPSVQPNAPGRLAVYLKSQANQRMVELESFPGCGEGVQKPVVDVETLARQLIAEDSHTELEVPVQSDLESPTYRMILRISNPSPNTSVHIPSKARLLEQTEELMVALFHETVEAEISNNGGCILRMRWSRTVSSELVDEAIKQRKGEKKREMQQKKEECHNAATGFIMAQYRHHPTLKQLWKYGKAHKERKSPSLTFPEFYQIARFPAVVNKEWKSKGFIKQAKIPWLNCNETNDGFPDEPELIDNPMLKEEDPFELNYFYVVSGLGSSWWTHTTSFLNSLHLHHKRHPERVEGWIKWGLKDRSDGEDELLQGNDLSNTESEEGNEGTEEALRRDARRKRKAKTQTELIKGAKGWADEIAGFVKLHEMRQATAKAVKRATKSAASPSGSGH